MALLGCSSCAALAAHAEEVTVTGPVSIQGRYFGALTWSDSLRDWRSRVLGERISRMPALGWFATHLDAHDLRAGWAFDVDPGQQKFVIHYRVRY